jgi:hypothetical protein
VTRCPDGCVTGAKALSSTVDLHSNGYLSYLMCSLSYRLVLTNIII